MVGEADVEGQREQIAGDAGQQVDGTEADGAQQGFSQQPKVPEAPHIGGDVEEADVDKDGREQAPPLAAEDEVGVGRSEVDQLGDSGFLQRDTAKHHPEEDGAVDSDQDIGGRSGEEIAAARAGAHRGRDGFLGQAIDGSRI